MDTVDLGKLMPELMQAHPHHVWTIRSSGGPSDDLRIEIRPVADQSRMAEVWVHAGAEVYGVTFEGHTDTDLVYEDDDRQEALEGRIELAVAATTGPTRVTLELAGERLIGSRMVIHPDGPTPRETGSASWPFRRLNARLRLRPIVERVIDLPAVPGD